MAAGVDLFTIGHGASALDEFLAALSENGIEFLVDVRRFPGSRRHPQFNAAPLAESLESHGIAYAQCESLGGRRRPEPDSPNVALRNEGFRGYADWMAQPAFAVSLDVLLSKASERRTAVMCAETPWWKCHRRLIADAAELLRGARVTHIVSGRPSPHRPTPEARVVPPGLLRYDGAV